MIYNIKKTMFVCIVMIFMFMFTGCVDYMSSVKIKENGKADISIYIAKYNVERFIEQYEIDKDYYDECYFNKLSDKVDVGFLGKNIEWDDSKDYYENLLYYYNDYVKEFGEDNLITRDIISEAAITKIKEDGWNVKKDDDDDISEGYILEKHELQIEKIEQEINGLTKIIYNDYGINQDEDCFTLKKNGPYYHIEWNARGIKDYIEFINSNKEIADVFQSDILYSLTVPYDSWDDNKDFSTSKGHMGKYLLWLKDDTFYADFSLFDYRKIVFITCIVVSIVITLVILKFKVFKLKKNINE